LGLLLLFGACGDDDVFGVHGMLAVAPEPLRFGAVPVGAEARELLELRNVGRGSLTILGVEGEDGFPDEFSLSSQEQKSLRGGARSTLEVRFRPMEERRYQGRLIVLTTSPTHPRIEVPIDGLGQRPSLACSPRLAFGKVALNTEKTLAVTCINGGRVPATVRVDGVGGDDPTLFSVISDQGSFEIPAGESLGIDVRFAAHRLGQAFASLDLVLEGTETPWFEVELSGEGYASGLVAAPSCLHFGAVGPGETATQRVVVANGGDATVTFEGPALVDASGVFSLAGSTVDGRQEALTTLEPGAHAELTVEFHPSVLGRYSGALRLRNDDPVASHLEVCLTGLGGGADIRAEPSPVDFGTVAVGMRVSQRVTVRNVGTLDGGPLRVFDATTTGDGFSTRFPGELTLAPSDPGGILEVTFEPTDERDYLGTLLITSNDGDEPTLAVPMVGRARALPPCSWEATPPSLGFGPVQRGGTYTLTTQIRNVGDDVCVVASPRLSTTTPSSFSLDPTTFSLRTLDPGEGVSVAVTFRADRVGSSRGALLFDVSDPVAPRGEIPLTSDVIDGCLSADPPGVDFGLRRVSCPVANQTVRLTNRCPSAVTVQGASLGAGSMRPGEFGISGLVAPVQIGVGGSRIFQVWYDPVDDGADSVAVDIRSTAHPLLLPLVGIGTTTDEITEVFRQKDRKPVDILFVIDNSGSMTDKQVAVANGTGAFMAYALQQGIDFHMGVTTTGIVPSTGAWAPCPGGANGGEAGRLFPVNNSRPRWVGEATPDAAGVFAQNVQVGICHWLEQGLEAAYLALTSPLVDHADDPGTTIPADGNLGFYRPEARLSVVVIGDEDDQSPRPTSFYSSFFRGLKGPGREDDVPVNVVGGRGCGFTAEEGVRFMEVARATGGMIEPICTEDWGQSLGRLAEQSFGYQLRFHLARVPEGSVRVQVNGRAVTAGWTYDAVENAVVSSEGSAPAPAATIEVTYIPAC
jgi:hypothetical protein